MARKSELRELRKLLKERQKLLKEKRKKEELQKLREEKKKLEKEIWMLKHPTLLKTKKGLAKGGKKLVGVLQTMAAGFEEMQSSKSSRRTSKRKAVKRKTKKHKASYSPQSSFGIRINPNFFKGW